MGKYKPVRAQFINDENGKKRYVVLSWKDFKGMCDVIEDHLDALAFDKAVAKSSGKLVSLDKVVAKMKRKGQL